MAGEHYFTEDGTYFTSQWGLCSTTHGTTMIKGYIIERHAIRSSKREAASARIELLVGMQAMRTRLFKKGDKFTITTYEEKTAKFEELVAMLREVE